MPRKSLYAITILFFLLIIFTGHEGVAETDAIVIRGTASLLHLCQELITLYGNQLPGASVGVNVAESVGSLPGGDHSIWQTIRPIDQTQREQLREKFGSDANEIPIAIEGVVVIVNRNNPTADLTLAQLREIYTGRTNNWREINGHDAAIRLYSTDALVGGSLFFTDLVLHGEEIDTTMRGFFNPKETERAVGQDVNGIGLIPLPGESDVKYPRIRRTSASPGVEASIENIRTLEYPLSSKVYWVIARRHSVAVTQLVLFTLSSRGQLAAEATGYYPLNPLDRRQAAAATAAPAH